jgi:DNA-binding beta-propeller fold protein YncE
MKKPPRIFRWGLLGLWIGSLWAIALATSLAGGVEAQTQGGNEPLLGYATGPDRVLVLDLTAFKRVKTIIGGEEVQFLSSSPKFGSNRRIYIADADARGLHVLDAELQEFVDFIPLEGQPNDFEILGEVALVNDFSGQRVLLLDLAAKGVFGESAVDGPAANEIALSPDGHRAYVTTFNFEEEVPHEASHPLVVFDVIQQPNGTLTLVHVGTVPLQEDLGGGEVIPYMASSVDVSSDGKRVYVLAVDDYEENPEVFVVDAESLEVIDILPVDLGRRAREPFVNVLVLSPDDKTLGISAFRNGLALLDVETGETRVIKPQNARLTDPSVLGVTFGPEGAVLYATGFVIGGEFGFVATFDPKTGEQLSVLTARRQPLLYLSIPGGKTF